jgi:hypothetical protein
MEQRLIENILAYEDGKLDQVETMRLIVVLANTHDLWVLKGMHGKIACIAMQLVDILNK